MTLTGDRGVKVPALARTLRGRSRVVPMLAQWSKTRTRVPGVSPRPIEVNGGAEALFLDAQQRVLCVWAIDIAGAQITSIRSVVNPDKPRHLGPVGDFASLVRGSAS